MGNDSERNQQDENSKKAWQTEDEEGDVSVSAVRHVGPTLESDPKYMTIEETGGQTSESLVEQGIGTDDSSVRDIISRGTDSDFRSRQQDGLKPNEPLKTRLPGDTSSDPHTDIGPENATNLPKKPDVKREAA